MSFILMSMPKVPIEADMMVIPCSDLACGHRTYKTIGWIRRNSSVQCAHCGSDNAFTAEPFFTQFKTFEDEHRKFLKTLRGMKTDIKF